ncbi:MAG TPA: hypothetical protein VH914_17520 [Acidimicrobiia bacterium]|nr:hypothetical protein [Acidimicrobiia bacterium]
MASSWSGSRSPPAEPVALRAGAGHDPPPIAFCRATNTRIASTDPATTVTSTSIP